MKKSSIVAVVFAISGVFNPSTAQESVEFQKLATVLGYSWKKAGAKPISLNDGQGIKLDNKGGMTPVSGKESTLTLGDLQKAVIDFYADKTAVKRSVLTSIFNATKCREVEAAVKDLLQENFAKSDDDMIVIPDTLMDRAGRELSDEQRAYFKDLGINVTHVNDKYVVTNAVGTDTPDNLRNVDVTEIGVSPKLGTILMDGDGNVYFAKA